MNIGIFGYGNLGRGVERGVALQPDMDLVGIFTRRDPATVKTQCGTPVYPAQSVEEFADSIDVMILCGGSATDLPVLSPRLAGAFHIVDSFDNHAHIPEHFAAVDKAARESGHLALISAGWDPGMFSLNRLYAEAILPVGATYTFWGRGVSQGHSDAIRRVPGVLDARQYTVPVPEALERVRNNEQPVLSARGKHLRECYVVAEEGADKAAIERAIKTMPDYFAPYDTTVTFVSKEELARDHAELPHGGFVIRTGATGKNGEHCQKIEYSLQLDSNPEFTSLALLAFSRAVYRMAQRGETGCRTAFDAAPADLSPLSREELLKNML